MDKFDIICYNISQYEDLYFNKGIENEASNNCYAKEIIRCTA